MNPQAVRSIVVVGGQLTGWTAAAAISHALQEQRIGITVLELPGMPAGSLAEATLPFAALFHRNLGINERDIMAYTQATFRLGTEFHGWWGEAAPGFMPLGQRGAGIGFLPFQHYLVRKHRDGDTTLPDAYSLCTQAARRGKFTHPVADATSVLSTLAYGLHVDTGRYTSYMRLVAEQNGARSLSAAFGEVRRRSGDGFIESVVLADGQVLEADLFIDASGGQACLIEGALGARFEDWSHWLPLRHVVSAQLPGDGAPPPCSSIRALPGGWIRQMPLQDLTVHEVVHADTGMESRKTLEYLGEAGVNPVPGTLRIGCLDRAWSANCIALGQAAGGLDSLTAGNLHLVQTALARLLELFPDRRCDPVLAGEYNLRTTRELESIRDFTLAHYLGTASIAPASTVDVPLPETLRNRISLFDSQGQLPQYLGDTIDQGAWVSLFLLQGNWPRSYNRCLDAIDLPRLDERFNNYRQSLEQCIGQMPAHGDVLRQYCPAVARPDRRGLSANPMAGT